MGRDARRIRGLARRRRARRARARRSVRYLTSTGENYLKGYTLPPNSRTTIWVDQEDIPAFGRVLANVAVAMQVTSTDAVPLVVERSMWWPDGNWQEAHNVVGAIETGPRWAIADGESGGDRVADTFLLLANMSTVAGDVLVTLLYEDGHTGDAFKRLAARDAAQYLIRPDGYIAYRCADHELAGVFDYVRRFLPNTWDGSGNMSAGDR